MNPQKNDFFKSAEINAKQGKEISKVGLILAATTGGVAVAISIVCYPFVSPAMRKICLPYVPATSTQIKNILDILKGRNGSLIDLGSGDGRIVFATAKAGFISHGIELNPWLVWYSKLKAVLLGLSSKTVFHRKDIWKYNLCQYNNVVIFGVEQMMIDIEKKFLTELNDNCLIVVCRFPLPNLEPIVTIGCGVDTVWAYKVLRKSK